MPCACFVKRHLQYRQAQSNSIEHVETSTKQTANNKHHNGKQHSTMTHSRLTSTKQQTRHTMTSASMYVCSMCMHVCVCCMCMHVLHVCVLHVNAHVHMCMCACACVSVCLFLLQGSTLQMLQMSTGTCNSKLSKWTAPKNGKLPKMENQVCIGAADA